MNESFVVVIDFVIVFDFVIAFDFVIVRSSHVRRRAEPYVCRRAIFFLMKNHICPGSIAIGTKGFDTFIPATVSRL